MADWEKKIKKVLSNLLIPASMRAPEVGPASNVAAPVPMERGAYSETAGRDWINAMQALYSGGEQQKVSAGPDGIARPLAFPLPAASQRRKRR